MKKYERKIIESTIHNKKKLFLRVKLKINKQFNFINQIYLL